MQVDDSLNCFSASFDALKALYKLSDVPSGLPKVRPLDNISKCRFLLPADDPNYFSAAKFQAKKAAEHAQKLSQLSESEKKILEIDEKRRKIQQDFKRKRLSVPQERVLQKITDKYNVGPLGMLLQCMKQQTRIRVIIRNVADIRGFCVGFLQAFDKHMNLVLRNVLEEYHVYEFPAFANDNEAKKKVRVQKQRRADQLFIKGDTIVLIHRCPEKT